MNMTIRAVMYADTILNLALMTAVLLNVPLLTTALRLDAQLPILGLAGLLGLSAAFHLVTGLSGNRKAVKVMILMDTSVLLLTLLLAAFNPLAAPVWLRGMLALLMGILKVLALRN
jgi:hypothetical protein